METTSHYFVDDCDCAEILEKYGAQNFKVELIQEGNNLTAVDDSTIKSVFDKEFIEGTDDNLSYYPKFQSHKVTIPVIKIRSMEAQNHDGSKKTMATFWIKNDATSMPSVQDFLEQKA